MTISGKSRSTTQRRSFERNCKLSMSSTPNSFPCTVHSGAANDHFSPPCVPVERLTYRGTQSKIHSRSTSEVDASLSAANIDVVAESNHRCHCLPNDYDENLAHDSPTQIVVGHVPQLMRASSGPSRVIICYPAIRRIRNNRNVFHHILH